MNRNIIQWQAISAMKKSEARVTEIVAILDSVVREVSSEEVTCE